MIRPSLETVNLGNSEHGTPLLVDRFSAEADHIVLINRVKAHTEFSHEFESGLLKMLAVGIGKRDGATLYHKPFMINGYPETILAVYQRMISQCLVLFAVSIVEDGYRNTTDVGILPSDNLVED